jgi:hypothetical protein
MTGGIETAENCKVLKVREICQIVEDEKKIQSKMPWEVPHLHPQILRQRHHLHNGNPKKKL